MSEAVTLPEGVKGYQCKHAVYCPPPKGMRDDYHLAKVTIHKTDGSTEPAVIMHKNFKRPIWRTKKGYQNHQDPKEWEDINKLDRFETTQSEMDFTIKKALGMLWHKGDPREVRKSPYLYGIDLLSTCVLKKTYMDKYPGLNAIYDVASFDVETDVVNGTDEITMATISYRDRVITAVQKSYLEGFANVEARLRELFDLYIGDVYADRNIKWDLQIVDREIDVVKTCFNKAHEWKPDFISIWNIDFDMSKMLRACERANYRPEDIFCDPAVPLDYRFFKYKKGPNMKVTASNKKMPIPPQAQWHTVFCPASFYFLDAMCVYWNLRSQKGKDPSYSLDAILNKTFKGKIRKLKLEAASHLRGIDWHKFMQTKMKLEYVIYNAFDCVGPELLDEETKDLRLTVPSFAEWTDLSNFASQPRRLVDRLHYFCLDHGRVIGSTSDLIKSDFDAQTTKLGGWIVTLPAHLVADNGVQVIEEDPELRTNIRLHVGDLDVAASYPNGECVYNISKETTKKEMISIEGVSNRTQRLQGINFSGGYSNAVEFCTDLFNLPTLDGWLGAFAPTVGQQFTIPFYQNLKRIEAGDDVFGDELGEEEDDDDDDDGD
jgi:hypothetical protein